MNLTMKEYPYYIIKSRQILTASKIMSNFKNTILPPQLYIYINVLLAM